MVKSLDCGFSAACQISAEIKMYAQYNGGFSCHRIGISGTSGAPVTYQRRSQHASRSIRATYQGESHYMPGLLVLVMTSNLSFRSIRQRKMQPQPCYGGIIAKRRFTGCDEKTNEIHCRNICMYTSMSRPLTISISAEAKSTRSGDIQTFKEGYLQMNQNIKPQSLSRSS